MNILILLITTIITIARETFNSVADIIRMLGISGVTAIARIVVAAGTADAIHTSDIVARYGIRNGARAWDDPAYENFLMERVPQLLFEKLGERFSLEMLAEAVYDLFVNASYAESEAIPAELIPWECPSDLVFEKLVNSKFFLEVTAANLDAMMNRFKMTPAGRRLSNSTITTLAESAANMLAHRTCMFAYHLVSAGIPDDTVLAILGELGYEGGDEIITTIRS